MICPKCGYESWSRDVVCTSCGCVLPAEPKRPGVQKAGEACRPRLDTPVLTRSAIKDSATSGVFVGGILCLTLAFLIRVFLAIRGDTFEAVNELLIMVNMTPLEGGAWMPLQSLLLSLLEQVPAIVLLTGLWTVFIGTAAKGVPPKAGLTVVRVGLVIDIIYLIMTGILSVVAVYMVSPDWAVVMALLLPGMYSLVVILRVKGFQSVATVRESLENGSPDSEISVAMSVFCFILGGLGILGSLTKLDIPGILTGISMIIFGVSSVGYRSSMAYVEGEIERGLSRPLQPVAQQIPTWKRVQMEQGLIDE